MHKGKYKCGFNENGDFNYLITKWIFSEKVEVETQSGKQSWNQFLVGS